MSEFIELQVNDIYCILYDGKNWKHNHDRLSGLAAAAAAIHIML
jgi:hypothetical protein